jgi:hypothetical protein
MFRDGTAYRSGPLAHASAAGLEQAAAMVRHDAVVMARRARRVSRHAGT